MNFEGGRVGFRYDAGGRVTASLVEGRTGPQDAEGINNLFKDNWVKTMADSGKVQDISLARSVVQAEARSIYLDQKALEAITAAGKGASPEAVFLKSKIVREITGLENRYGDVLK